jgi:hypothetical protein
VVAGRACPLPGAVAILALAALPWAPTLVSAAAWVAPDDNQANSWHTTTWLRISLSPTSGKKGSTIDVAGSGFAPGAVLSATFAGSPAPWTSGRGKVAATPSGEIPPGTTIFAPALLAGQYQLKVSDTAGNSAAATFVLTN